MLGAELLHLRQYSAKNVGHVVLIDTATRIEKFSYLIPVYTLPFVFVVPKALVLAEYHPFASSHERKPDGIVRAVREVRPVPLKPNLLQLQDFNYWFAVVEVLIQVNDKFRFKQRRGCLSPRGLLLGSLARFGHIPRLTRKWFL